MLVLFDIKEEVNFFDDILFWRKREVELIEDTVNYKLVHLSKKAFERNAQKEIRRGIKSVDNNNDIFIEPIKRKYAVKLDDFTEINSINLINAFSIYQEEIISKFDKFLGKDKSEITVAIVDCELNLISIDSITKLAREFSELYVYTDNPNFIEISDRIYYETGAHIFTSKIKNAKVNADIVLLLSSAIDLEIRAKIIFNPYNNLAKIRAGRVLKKVNVEAKKGILETMTTLTNQEKITLLYYYLSEQELKSCTYIGKLSSD